MALFAFFSKKERLRRKRKKAEEKDKRSLLQNDHDIREFVTWYFRRRYFDENGQRLQDKDVNFIWLGYEAQEHFQYLVNKHPYVNFLTKDKNAYVTAKKRLYKWLDDEGNWNYWTREEMEEHYKVFIANENENPVYGDYILAETGPMGSSKAYPACAYLSYAYHEDIRWFIIIQKLKEFMETTTTEQQASNL